MPLPYREEMETAFGQDFSGVAATRTDRAALGGSSAMAHGEEVAFTSDSPSKHVVAHELAHVVQHRRGEIDGAHFDDGVGIHEQAANIMAAAAAPFDAKKAVLPRPLMLEVLGDRFSIQFKASNKNELVMAVQYVGPYPVDGKQLVNNTFDLTFPRPWMVGARPLINATVLEVRSKGLTVDVTGTGEEIAVLEFTSTPDHKDVNAREVRLHGKTNNQSIPTFGDDGFHIRLPNSDRAAPAGLDAAELARVQVSSAALQLGPDSFTLGARRFAESDEVQLFLEGAGATRISGGDNPNILVPMHKSFATVALKLLKVSGRQIEVDLDGDGEADVRLVHTANASDPVQGTRLHRHALSAYDRHGVNVGAAYVHVVGEPWDVPVELDRAKTPLPASQPTPSVVAPIQGDVPLEGSVTHTLRGGDREIRVDLDGDRRKEILLRFHGENPTTITATQLSSGASHSFQLTSQSGKAMLSPLVVHTSEGNTPGEPTRASIIQVYGSEAYGQAPPGVEIPPAFDDVKEGRRVYMVWPTGCRETKPFELDFPREKEVSAPLAQDAKDPSSHGGVWSSQVRLGEMGDPFLFTLEWAPGGLTFGVAGMNDSGPVSGLGIRLLNQPSLPTIKAVSITNTSVGFDIDSDGTADVHVYDSISGRHSNDYEAQGASAERRHDLSIHGGGVEARSAVFVIRGRKFVPALTEQKDAGSVVNREAAGAALASHTIAGQEVEGSDIDQMIARYKGGISAQVLQAGQEGLLSSALVSAWTRLGEDLPIVAALDKAQPASTDARAAVARKLAESRSRAAADARTVYQELAAATTGQHKISKHDKFQWENPYTGAPSKWTHVKGDLVQVEKEPGIASLLGDMIEQGNQTGVGMVWPRLKSGVEQWALKKLEDAHGKDSAVASQGRYMTSMVGQLDKIKGKTGVKRVYGSFIPDDSHRKEKNFFEALPLQLWVWREGDEWWLRDLTNPEKTFDCHMESSAEEPPHELFMQLDDKKQFAKGVIRYQTPGPNGQSNQVICHARKKWYEWVADIGLALAAIGLALVTFGAGTVAVIGSYILAASAIASIVAAGGEMHDAYEHGYLDGAMIVMNVLQIASSVASAGAIVAGNLVRGATAAAGAAQAGKGAAWTGRMAKLAAMADKAYVPLTVTALGADVTTVAVMSATLVKQLQQIDETVPEPQKTEAKKSLILHFALIGGITALSVKGDLPQIKQGKVNIVLDQMNGKPVAHAAGVRAGGVDINVSAKGPDGKDVVDPARHAAARWQSPHASGLNEAELEWYRAWMGQERKVKFKPNGEPEIIWPDMAGKPKPEGLEAKLTGMVKSSDIASYEKAFARASEVEALRAANGGHLDIDPTAPNWPAERAKLKDKLAADLGSNSKAEAMLRRYESFRKGGLVDGNTLHTATQKKLDQVLPAAEIDHLRRIYPECQVYVTGGALKGDGAGKLDKVSVVVVVPPGTAPDLMGAMEQRAQGIGLRPDPDYLKANQLNENSTLPVEVKAVSSDQFFGMATTTVKGKGPLDLHRVDLPSTPEGRPYTPAELDSMHRAGYEFDSASGQFKLRAKESRTALPGQSTARLRGDNVVVGEPLHSEAVAEEVLRKLGHGEAEVLRVVGIEPPPGFNPLEKEWGIGQRVSDGRWVLVEGGPDAVNWGKVPGVRSRGHAHPLELGGKPRLIEGPAGRNHITIDELRTGKVPAELMKLCPSGSDFARAAVDGRHMVATPYVYLGEGKIGNRQPGGMEDIVEFDILRSTVAGLAGDTVYYKAYVKIRAGKETLYEGPMWGGQLDYGTVRGSDVTFTEPWYLKPAPADVQVGSWSYRNNPGGGGGVTGANVDDLAIARTQTADQRREALGKDPIKGDVPHEGEAGAYMEASYGFFKRDPSGAGEWVSLSGPYENKVFDLVGFPPSAAPHVKVSEFNKSIDWHVLKQIDYVVVDIRLFASDKRTAIKAHVDAKHAAHKARIIYLE